MSSVSRYRPVYSACRNAPDRPDAAAVACLRFNRMHEIELVRCCSNFGRSNHCVLRLKDTQSTLLDDGLLNQSSSVALVNLVFRKGSVIIVKQGDIVSN